ncbi:MAG TPA: hypothetical protein VF529_02275 [Solirubrobacteraceae bacterium]
MRRVRSTWIRTRVVARVRGRTIALRLTLAQMLFAGGTTTLTLDPTTFPEGGEAAFRIIGGRLQAETARGELAHRGVLSLGPVALQDIGFLGGVGMTAQFGDVRGLVATAGPARARRSGPHGVRIGPVPARFTEDAAERLNFYFQTDRFREGMPLGTVTVRGRLRG